MTEIYLIRHAEAEGNIFRRLHGQYDSLLTPRGHRQVEALQKRFQEIHIDACYSSDLTRASLTARAIYVPKGLKLHRDKRFRELNVGIWEDMPYGYLDNFEAARMHDFTKNPPAFMVDGAESFDTYTSRFLAGFKDAAQANDGKTIAIFSHGAVIRSTLMRLFFMDDLSKLPFSDNTGVSRLFYDNGRITYDYLNDNSHVPQELSTFYIQRWWRETDKRKEAGLYFRSSGDEGNIEKIDAILLGQQIGTLSLEMPNGEVGYIVDLWLYPAFYGRYYADQLLGEAFSRFRRAGCKSIHMNPGSYPDDVFSRYDFHPVTGIRSIDTTVFQWE